MSSGLFQYSGSKDGEPESQPEAKPPPKAKRLYEIKREVAGGTEELLKNRFLCRGSGMLLVGPSGIGKSSFCMQAMLHWAAGVGLFGIQPAKPLRSLLIQAENDDGDIAEMRDGVLGGLQLTDQEKTSAAQNIFVCREDARSGMGFFLQVVEPLVQEHQPDLLWIDPALSYLGGDASAQQDVSLFLRNLLNPILRRRNIGAVVVHHTSKPPQHKEKSAWSGGDFAYSGSGSAEWANWARGVLAIRSLGLHDTFELIAGKRGSRLGWKAPDGTTKAYSKTIGHSDHPGVISWREVDSVAARAATRTPTTDQLMALVPLDQPISKPALQSMAHGTGIAHNRINGLIAQLITEKRLYEWKVPRSGTRPEIHLARHPQPEPQLL